MKKYIAIILMGLAAFSCTDPLTEIEIIEFGAKLAGDVQMPLSYKSGEFTIDIVSDGDFSAVVEEGSDWLYFEGGSSSVKGTGDMTSLTVGYMPNRTVLRSGKIVLTRGGRKVELSVSQIGILSEEFSVVQQNISAGAEGGQMRAKVLTLAGPEDIETSVTYLEDNQGEWISQLMMDNNFLKFHVSENLSEVVRHAVIEVSKKETDFRGYIQVSQTPIGFEYESLSISELKDLMPDGGVIDRHLVLSDVIVLNDNLEGNGADNRMVSSAVQDLNVGDRTLYVSDAPGNHGLRLEFKEKSVLYVNRYDKIEVDLYGAVLTKVDSPEHYYVTGIPASSVLESEAGSLEDLTVKKKAIGELQDSDIYTLVELSDCELPVRKGPYIGIDLRYYNIMTKYPMVIRDVHGDDMHMVVNTTCLWHRDGTRMPQGSGSVLGVIVHEHCDNFEWNTAEAKALAAEKGLSAEYVNGIGDIGDYQIRPICKDDIMISNEFESGFSELICEFRFHDKNDMLMVNATDYTLLSRDPKGETMATMTLWEKSKEGEYSQQTFSASQDWTMLGPYVNGVIEDISNGNGVECERENATSQSAFWTHNATADLYASKYGSLMSVYGSAWSATKWSKTKFWQVEFSTEGYGPENGNISIQIGMVNDDGDRVGGPLNWVLEYLKDDGQWGEIARYTVPDFPASGRRNVWNLPGHKYMTFTIPAEIDLWGRELVTVRMRPRNLLTGNHDSYDEKSGLNENVNNSMNYFAVRCNKTK